LPVALSDLPHASQDNETKTSYLSRYILALAIAILLAISSAIYAKFKSNALQRRAQRFLALPIPEEMD